MTPEVTEVNAVDAMSAAAQALPKYPGGFEGRGVVICGGGARYFTCAYVCVRMLREVGCVLPVELWHIGSAEMDEEMRGLITPLGVTCVDAAEVRRSHPARTLGGYELKPYAILHSRFREVLLLDADNFPLVDPSFLFDTPQYREHGAIFWPDYGRLGPQRDIWRLAGVAYRDEPEFESGQIAADKERCWTPLNLAMWMNEHSDFWYRHVWGDKDTFHLAWRRLGLDYAMPGRPIENLADLVMCQHDFEGRRVFQHRNQAKWTLYGDNPRVPGFLQEDTALTFLEDLRRRWAGRPRPYCPRNADEGHRAVATDLCGRAWRYRRVGHDERPMTFIADGQVGEGAAGCEQWWALRRDAGGGEDRLLLLGREGVTCVLSADGPGRWAGAWLVHERMPVELVGADPVEPARTSADASASAAPLPSTA